MPEWRAQDGTASIEFIGVIPTMIAVTGLVWQLVLAGGVAVAAENAARNASRVAGQGAADAVVAQRALDSLPGWVDRGATTVTRPGGTRVAVRVEVPLLFPGVSLDDVAISRSAEFPTTAGGSRWG